MRSPSEAGFTLLEVLVAMTILAVGLAALISIFTRSTAAISEAQGFERAGTEARMRLAQFLNGEELPPTSEKGECITLPNGRWSIEYTTAPERPGVGIVTVKVSFKAGGRQRVLTMKTAQVNFELPLRVENKHNKEL